VSEGPKVEVTQHDRLDEWRRGIAAVEKQLEEDRPRVAAERAEAARLAAYGLRETLYFRCRKLPAKEGELPRYRADCIAGLPAQVTSVWATAETPEDAAHEGRFRYAEGLYKSRICDTWEAAKERAAKVEVIVADVV
jgi:hypothetical protein